MVLSMDDQVHNDVFQGRLEGIALRVGVGIAPVQGGRRILHEAPPRGVGRIQPRLPLRGGEARPEVSPSRRRVGHPRVPGFERGDEVAEEPGRRRVGGEGGAVENSLEDPPGRPAVVGEQTEDVRTRD